MPSSNSYNLDFTRLVTWLTPKAFRKPKLAILLQAIVFPFVWLHANFLKYREAKIYQITITPQVCYLERMLNDRFDSSLRRISIGDAVWHLPLFIYQEAELKPQALFLESENHPRYVFTEGEAGSALNDFIVLVPSAVSFSDAEMRAMLDSYKLFGTSYTIQII
jgi:hypothetical protein